MGRAIEDAPETRTFLWQKKLLGNSSENPGETRGPYPAPWTIAFPPFSCSSPCRISGNSETLAIAERAEAISKERGRKNTGGQKSPPWKGSLPDLLVYLLPPLKSAWLPPKYYVDFKDFLLILERTLVDPAVVQSYEREFQRQLGLSSKGRPIPLYAMSSPR